MMHTPVKVNIKRRILVLLSEHSLINSVYWYNTFETRRRVYFDNLWSILSFNYHSPSLFATVDHSMSTIADPTGVFALPRERSAEEKESPSYFSCSNQHTISGLPFLIFYKDQPHVLRNQPELSDQAKKNWL